MFLLATRQIETHRSKRRFAIVNRSYLETKGTVLKSTISNPKSGASVDHLQGIKTVKSRDNGVAIRGNSIEIANHCREVASHRALPNIRS